MFGLSPTCHCVVDTIGQLENNPLYQTDNDSPSEPQLKYKYDETLSARSVGGSSQPSQSLRSIFDTVKTKQSGDGDVSSEDEGHKSDRSYSISSSITSFIQSSHSDHSLTKPLLEAGLRDLDLNSFPMLFNGTGPEGKCTESPVESPTASSTICVKDRCGHPLSCSVVFVSAI